VIVVDTSVLVAELLRARGRALMRDPKLQISITEEQRSETDHEIERRLRSIIERWPLSADEIAMLRQGIETVIETIQVAPRQSHEHFAAVARRRIPRDPDDWPTVALAITLNAGILTNDRDFLGCGCPTWTFETLSLELAEG
jgi:predicted nucleic acid-binding protein